MNMDFLQFAKNQRQFIQGIATSGGKLYRRVSEKEG
jgi:hypothetical protein